MIIPLHTESMHGRMRLTIRRNQSDTLQCYISIQSNRLRMRYGP